jgi:glycosyltransferase involved in cell wall biosynthesis
MKAVVVHRGGRDAYQVARALSEANMLESLVTDLYWPAEHSRMRLWESAMPDSVRRMCRQRWAGTPLSGSVKLCWASGLASLAMDKSKRVPFAWQRGATRWADRRLGKTAGRIATDRHCALLSYSYYAHAAFSEFSGNGPRILFQVHPHPTALREILLRERNLHPECAPSLDKEWELALPKSDFDRLAEESLMADHWIVASSFTRATLVSVGVPEHRIHVAPYGTDLNRFHPPSVPRSPVRGRPVRLLFTGTVNQRKGIKYLLEALDQIRVEAELTICGRIVDDLSIIRNRRNVRVRSWVSPAELVEAYQTADLFVFPSVAEGFGHVVLEALACGLPVLSTTRTAAQDIVRHGRDGFIVEPGRPDLLAQAITRFALLPESHSAMNEAARMRAKQFTWELFRARIVEIVDAINAAPVRAAAT